MGSVTVNFSDVESFEPMPEGEYAVEVDKVEVRRNKADDGDYLNWELLVIDGDYENRRLWMITSLKPKALYRLKQTFVDLGIIEDDDDEDLDLEYDDDIEIGNQEGPRLIDPDLDGLECTAVVKNQMYEGKERNRVEELFVERAPKKKAKKATPKKTRSQRDEEPYHSSDEQEEEAPRRSRGTANDGSRSSRTAKPAGRRRMR